MVAVAVLLSRPGIAWAGLWLSPAALVSLVAALFYLRLDLRYGMLMSAVLALCLWLVRWPPERARRSGWVSAWAVRGRLDHPVHRPLFRGRKPAFIDDLSGLIIGPLFVAAELGFMLGLREPLRLAIEARVGPVRLRHTAAHG